MENRLSSRNPSINSDESELFQLMQRAGYDIEFDTFKALLDLIKLNISPVAISRILQKVAKKTTASTVHSGSSR